MVAGVDQWHRHEVGELLYGEVCREKERIHGGIQWKVPVGVLVVS